MEYVTLLGERVSKVPATGGLVSSHPLIGGSGGGGGRAGYSMDGAGGGGGGGAILIAAEGTITIDNQGEILAKGGNGGNAYGPQSGGPGGGGSGGAIRLVATVIEGNGSLDASGGLGGLGQGGSNRDQAGNGSPGRIRLEANSFLRDTTSTPDFTVSTPPQTLFSHELPSLRITKVANQTVPAATAGYSDIQLDDETLTSVTVDFESTNVPDGSTIKLIMIPQGGALNNEEVDDIPLTNSVATAEIEISSGTSVLQASLTYTVSAEEGDQLARFTEGERVQSVRLLAGWQGEGQTELTTVSGQRYTWPSSALATY